MENQQLAPQEEEKEMSLEDKVEFMGMMTMIRNFVPNLPAYYPVIEDQKQNLINKMDEYVNGKMIVAFQVKGKTQVVVIDATKDFTITHNAATGEKKFDGTPLLRGGVRDFFENKILGNSKIKFFLDYMKSEWNEKFKDQAPPELPSFNKFM